MTDETDPLRDLIAKRRKERSTAPEAGQAAEGGAHAAPALREQDPVQAPSDWLRAVSQERAARRLALAGRRRANQNNADVY